MSQQEAFATQRPYQQSWIQRLITPLRRPGKRWQGGLKLKDYKSLSNGQPIKRHALANSVLSVPVGNGRTSATPCVAVGQQLKKGDVIAHGDHSTPWVHASTSGRVTAIQTAYLADRDSEVVCIQIEADGRDEWCKLQPGNPPRNAEELSVFAMQMGLVGLGGAGFPTGIKISGAQQPDMLLINGAECEPFVTCDDRLMRERADDIIRAADYLASALSIQTARIGVEPNKPEAIKALQHAIRQRTSTVEVHTLPHRYPAGGQPMLIRSLSGRKLATGMLPAEVGVFVLNVATLYALGRAVFHAEPLVTRIVTLTGHVHKPGNLEVPIGTPVADLLREAVPHADNNGVQVGGPMMGHLLTQPKAVTSKTCGCLIVRSTQFFPARTQASDCIRCNRCIDVCPMALKPLKLYEAYQRQDGMTLQQEQLNACIECGACSEVCPSNLPLRDSFREAKKIVVGSARQ
ncbi:electron transport complex subunit RsxC [Pontibacterium granulatum]|uniref:electron transport complex subunit RsxC n=1 Tax=Pontibacterium granulatum TaxID=2036029 RepID=UPI00249A227D|nr:electron transport complex subunit RsxC [Pontibacterium granulatum]MDI3324586.1 electron transport complex subunit RsxC [Pontibacterium granulatum]